jgi:hypothetical protein
MRQIWICAAFVVVAAGLSGCHSHEAPRVKATVVVDGSRLNAATSDLGYTVEVTGARMAMKTLTFSVAGEEHTRRWWHGFFIKEANAHPGHHEGGAITGALEGSFLVDWTHHHGHELGDAALIVGEYTSANFIFGHDEALGGATLVIEGVATRDEQKIPFEVSVSAPKGRQLIGAPFEASVRKDGRVGLVLSLEDEVGDGGMVFDGVDFASLSDQDGKLVLSEQAHGEAYLKLRRRLLSHDHYLLTWKD